MVNTLKTFVLLVLLSMLLLVAGGAVAGEGGVVIAFIIALAFNFFAYWASDKVVLRLYRAQPVGPEHPLHQITSRLAERANLPMPRVYVIPKDAPNAFATGRNPQHAAVAATEGLLRSLDRSELEGVIAHELAHIRHRDILISSIAATIATAIMFLARMAQFAAIFGGGDRRDNIITILTMAIVAPVAALLIQSAISRSREYAADRGAVEIVGSPNGLVRALQKIESAIARKPMDANPATAHLFIMKPFSGRGVLSFFSTHPPTEKRIQAMMALR